jgi:type I restriction enzyme M protein
MTTNGIVQKLWNYSNVLRDDGLSYGDYVEQLTFLLFLKMADEQTRPPFNKPPNIPKGLDWPSLLERDGDELETQYRHVLTELGKSKGTLGVIFRKAPQNKIQDPAKLDLEADVKGEAYEGLLQKNAEDVKGGAGQYFTPRPLIEAIVDVMQPRSMETIHDPACGTGGFLLKAHRYISRDPNLDKDQKRHLRTEALSGVEIVDATARLCAMNLYLHGIGGDDCRVGVADSLNEKPKRTFDVVLTNPPFGKKSSITVINEEGEQSKESLVVVRDDFWSSA